MRTENDNIVSYKTFFFCFVLIFHCYCVFFSNEGNILFKKIEIPTKTKNVRIHRVHQEEFDKFVWVKL